MNTVVKIEPLGLDAIPFQEASLDIWDKKYRLTAKDGAPIDRTMDDTYKRVARALADVEHEDVREHWNERFLWALRRGAIPAGRIISNAGALEHKPATSTINCTVSGTIHDSMDDILKKVHEAGLTLKAGCVAPGTWVYTEHGLVTADQAVHEKHQRILCYDVRTHRFEKRAILRHLTTHVPQSEQIRITSQGTTLTTSIRHPVLVYRAGHLGYVRADEVTTADALVRHQLPWTAAADRWLDAWFTGAHLGDGSAYVKKFTYKHTQKAWAARALALGQRLVFKIRAVEREVVQRYAAFFATFAQSRAKAVPAMTLTGTLVWDYTVASFAASRAAALIDGQIGEKSTTLRVPKWIAREPERFFLPFLAGLIDTDGTVNTEHGSATIATACHSFAGELQSLLGLFGVHGSITLRRPRDHMLNGHVVRDRGGAIIKICDSAFLATVAQYMADTGKRNRIRDHASTPGQYDVFQMPAALRAELERETEHLTHVEKQRLGIYHGYHRRERVSRVWIDRWAQRFAPLAELIGFALSLRPVDAIERDLSLSETFFDFTVDRHNNYLAGNNGLAVIHNCGIGYEFSTLRPRGAYVSGAGAYTSGPLSFMDIFDKMCFTISSAGGRRGAQMGTFDIGHPDVMEFIRAKRESGRLRQFNLSLLITDEFMQAVREDCEWKLAFPLSLREYEADKPDLTDAAKFLWREWPVHEGYVVNDEGLVACRIYKTLPARRMWDVIMTSTYDFAEPGFILIDRANEMNNNWWCENIRATNPCVTADTWVQTSEGPREVSELIGRQFVARVDGKDYATGAEGFFMTARKPVVRIETTEGYSLRLTADHRVRRYSKLTRWTCETEWCAASELRAGDRVVLNDHRGNASWAGAHTREEGYLIGLMVGDGVLKSDTAVLSVWGAAAAANGPAGGIAPGVRAIMAEAVSAATTLAYRYRSDFRGWNPVGGRTEWRMELPPLKTLAESLGMRAGQKSITPAMERASSGFCRGFLRGFFDTDGCVQGHQEKGVSVRLAQSDFGRLQAVQRMLLRLGIVSRIYRDRRAQGSAVLPDGKGGMRAYPTLPQHELAISSAALEQFASKVGFSDSDKQMRLERLLSKYRRALNRERFAARVERVIEDGAEGVYDVQVPGVNAFDANGLHAHNCGEQTLPEFGACLLGSVNLTRFVKHPFTDFAEFDWSEYREVVKVFARMLDNVVEVNGLPLEKQREEILRKRRHGMGFLGLGSTLALLRMKYGSPEAVQFTEDVTREMAVAGWEAALELAREKGPAPIMNEEFTVTKEMLRKRPEMARDGWKPGVKIAGRLLHAKYSRYMQRIAQVAPQLVHELAETGARFTHHTSIAPTGTISLSLANNASNGIEPSFAHHYFRNVIREGKKSKEKIDVYSFELLAYRELVNPNAQPGATNDAERLPDYFIASDGVTPKEHVEVQAAAQKWVDSSISKTANVPTDFPYAKFKDIYLYAHEQGLKGCTTFRFNPEAFQGVLVKEQDLKNTLYKFTLEDGTVVEARGDEEIDYDGELHTAANLFDAIKDGYYGRM